MLYIRPREKSTDPEKAEALLAQINSLRDEELRLVTIRADKSAKRSDKIMAGKRLNQISDTISNLQFQMPTSEPDEEKTLADFENRLDQLIEDLQKIAHEFVDEVKKYGPARAVESAENSVKADHEAKMLREFRADLGTRYAEKCRSIKTVHEMAQAYEKELSRHLLDDYYRASSTSQYHNAVECTERAAASYARKYYFESLVTSINRWWAIEVES